MVKKDKPGRKGRDDEDDEDSPFMPLEDVLRKLKAGPLNFGVYQTGDKNNPVMIAAHKRKNPAFLGKQAKKEAGTSKGAYGTLTLQSGVLQFECENDDPPASLKKRIKSMLREMGFNKFKPKILLPGGGELGDDDGDDEDDEDARAAARLIAPGGAATRTRRGGKGKDDPEALKAEAAEALKARIAELEQELGKAGLEGERELPGLLSDARAAAGALKLRKAEGLLDRFDKSYRKAQKAAGEAGDAARGQAKVEAAFADHEARLEALAGGGDRQADKLLGVMRKAIEGGDWKKAQGALKLVAKFTGAAETEKG